MTDDQRTGMSALARSIIDLADAVTGLRETVGAAYGVSDNELRAAVRIATEQKPTPGVLADRLHLSSAALTVIIDHLVDRGIALRMPNPKDRRSTLLALTPDGERMVRDELAVLDGSLAGLDGVTADEIATALAGIANEVTPGT